VVGAAWSFNAELFASVPALSTDDQSDGCAVNAIKLAQTLLRDMTRSVNGSDFANLLPGQPSESVVFAAVAHKAITVLGNHVLRVFDSCALSQMQRFDAGRCIALMQRAKALGDWAVMQNPACSVCEHVVESTPYLAIALVDQACRPDPTRSKLGAIRRQRPVFVYFSDESPGQRWAEALGSQKLGCAKFRVKSPLNQFFKHVSSGGQSVTGGLATALKNGKKGKL
jgi:hypothetical protein